MLENYDIITNDEELVGNNCYFKFPEPFHNGVYANSWTYLGEPYHSQTVKKLKRENNGIILARKQLKPRFDIPQKYPYGW
jgi:hypothetical protein